MWYRTFIPKLKVVLNYNNRGKNVIQKLNKKEDIVPEMAF